MESMRVSNRWMGASAVVSASWLLAASSLMACGGAEPGGSDESVGEAVVELSTVPAGAQCLQVVGTGASSFSLTVPLTAGASSASLSLGRLPLGSSTINASVYDVACASLAGASPTWVADTIGANFKVGWVTSLTLTLHQINPVVANANFVGNIVSIAAGAGTTALVMSDGTVRTAGSWYPLTDSNVFTKQSALAGVLEMGPPGFDLDHACARTASQVKCWGYNNYGQLGTGTIGGVQSAPVVVTGVANASAIAVAGQHTCALAGGTVSCWGYNGTGQLGNGMTTDSATPVPVAFSPSPPASPDLLSAGALHTCANTAKGVACWGANANGQLGDGTTTYRTTPVYPAGVDGTISLAAGIAHTCAVRADGTVRCWGVNSNGQLGDGTTTQRLTPTLVPGITDALQVAVGWYHTCIRRATGAVSCFGLGQHGELGDATAQSRSTPAPVPNLVNVVAISAAVEHTCALMDDQHVVCWGDDSAGACGDGKPGNNYKISFATIQ